MTNMGRSLMIMALINGALWAAIVALLLVSTRCA